MYTTNLYNYCPGLYEQNIHKLSKPYPNKKVYAKPYTYSLDLDDRSQSESTRWYQYQPI